MIDNEIIVRVIHIGPGHVQELKVPTEVKEQADAKPAQPEAMEKPGSNGRDSGFDGTDV